LREEKYAGKMANGAKVCKIPPDNKPVLANLNSRINADLQTYGPIRSSNISQISGQVPMFQKLRKI
jgi:hypothetical protein